jgi:predicted RNA-binding protein YlqC (UPF0109 family)
MKELLEFIVKSIVDFPDQVQIDEIDDDASTILELSVAESDMGRVIGRGGRVINSLRAVMHVSAAKQGRRVTLELLESGERR